MNAPHPQAQPAPPIAGGPSTSIPQTDIPHMGTSQAEVATPQVGGAPQTQAQPQQAQAQQPQPQPQPQPQTQAQVQMPPLPAGVTQQDVDAAIQHVQQTGSTDGIKPDVLAAACAQLEAQAAAQGIDLNAHAAAAQGPENHAEAAVMDKDATFEQFDQQRDALKAQVAEQRDAMVNTYGDALAKNKPGADAMTQEQMNELVRAMKDLDPSMINLINAFSAVTSNPSVLNSIIWVEIIRMLRRLIASEAQKQIHETMPRQPQ